MLTIYDKEELRIKLKESTFFNNKNNCWEYVGNINTNGYGALQINNKVYLVHRLSLYIFKNFNLNSSFLVLHKPECNWRNCWNPDHLYAGNHLDNIKDVIKSGKHNNANKTHCIHGHEFTPENTKYKGTRRNCRSCSSLDNNKRYAELKAKKKKAKLKKL